MTAMRTEFEQFKRSLIETGIEKGIGKGQAQAIVQVLEARGVPLSDSARARILACAELDTLHRWLVGALTVQSADDLFAAQIDADR